MRLKAYVTWKYEMWRKHLVNWLIAIDKDDE